MSGNYVNKQTREGGLYPKSSGDSNVNENQIVTPFDWYLSADKQTVYVTLKDGYEMVFDGTGWESLSSADGDFINSWVGAVHYIRKAGHVTLQMGLDGSSATDVEICTLPEGFRPGRTMVFYTLSPSTGDRELMNINTDGEILSSSANSDLTALITFPSA